jgi:carbamoyltransferase
MIILGVCNAPDSGAALIVDGELVAAVNEERFVRSKLFRGFPKLSLEWVLRSQHLTVADVDLVGCGAWAGMSSEETLPRLVEDIYYQVSESKLQSREAVMKRIEVSARRDAHFRRELANELTSIGFRRDQIIYCDHHYSHALTAFMPSPFEEAFVYCADGRGDYRSVTLWRASRSNGIELLDLSTELVSPGALYGLITKQIGFTPDRHEGKVTGLAARGQETELYRLLKGQFNFDANAGRLRSKIGAYYLPFLTATLPELSAVLRGYSREDSAYAVQRVLEEALCDFLMHHLKDAPGKSVNLCLSGGCMGNVKLNYELGRLFPIRNLYVYPAMGDGGNAVGGALHVAMQHDGLTHISMPTVYLGPCYTNSYIEKALRKAKLPYAGINPADKARQVAQWLADGEIVGWFQGRMEYGPRALGARSILASPCDPTINDKLNIRLHRSEFMPFAPVTTDLLAPQCFMGWQPDHVASEFMTVCYQCHPLTRDKCPAVVHVDNSARPQVIHRGKNPSFYDLVTTYYEETGVPCLINTSFNHHEEPIVNTPEDAIRSLVRGNVDILVIGDFSIALKEIKQEHLHTAGSEDVESETETARFLVGCNTDSDA